MVQQHGDKREWLRARRPRRVLLTANLCHQRLSVAALIFFSSMLLAAVPCPARTDAVDAWGRAIIGHDIPAVERLVAAGVDVNRAAENGQTALMLAAAEGHRPLLQLLLGRGAGVNTTNSRGGTALMYAATAGDVDAVQLLLVRGASTDARATNGWTALTLASARGFERVAATLLMHGADPNVPDIYGWTPLMRAVQQNRPAVVQALLRSNRTDINARNENGRTALHLAAFDGLTDVARVLVERGANARVLDRTGRTSAALAIARGHTATAKVIDEASEN